MGSHVCGVYCISYVDFTVGFAISVNFTLKLTPYILSYVLYSILPPKFGMNMIVVSVGRKRIVL